MTGERRPSTSLSADSSKGAKIGANIIRHGRLITFQMAEVTVSRADVEDQRQTWPIWSSAEDVRPDAGLWAQVLALTAIVDQSAGLQQFFR
jgi:hypothetical protein